jgi:hypothetical protein
LRPKTPKAVAELVCIGYRPLNEMTVLEFAVACCFARDAEAIARACVQRDNLDQLAARRELVHEAASDCSALGLE